MQLFAYAMDHHRINLSLNSSLSYSSSFPCLLSAARKSCDLPCANILTLTGIQERGWEAVYLEQVYGYQRPPNKPKQRGKYKKKEKCKRVDTLVDVDTDSETESSDGKDKNMEFDKIMSSD